jgi:hypothetical protein
VGGPLSVGCMMQDGGTDRAPIDRFQKELGQSPTTRPRAKKNRVKQLSLATFIQQRVVPVSYTSHGQWPDCAKFLFSV